MDFSRQEYWNGLPLPPPGDLPDPGIIPDLLHCRHILYRLSHQTSPPYVCAFVWEDGLAFCMACPEVCASAASPVERSRVRGQDSGSPCLLPLGSSSPHLFCTVDCCLISVWSKSSMALKVCRTTVLICFKTAVPNLFDTWDLFHRRQFFHRPGGRGVVLGMIQAHYSEVKIAQSCPTLWDPTGYAVHGILQAGILEWVAFPFSAQGLNQGLRHHRQILYQLSHKGSPTWMASPTRWTWVWASSGSWWWTGKPGVPQSVGSQRAGHDWASELNWSTLLLLRVLLLSHQLYLRSSGIRSWRMGTPVLGDRGNSWGLVR